MWLFNAIQSVTSRLLMLTIVIVLCHDRDRCLWGNLTVTGWYMSRAVYFLQCLVIQGWKRDFSFQNSNWILSPSLENKENKEFLSFKALNDTKKIQTPNTQIKRQLNAVNTKIDDKANLIQKSFNNQCSVSDTENKPFWYSFLGINQEYTWHKLFTKITWFSYTDNIQIVNWY